MSKVVLVKTLGFSFLMPFLFSFIPGWLMQNHSLMAASYTVIALPSVGFTALYLAIKDFIVLPRVFSLGLTILVASGFWLFVVYFQPLLLSDSGQVIGSFLVASVASFFLVPQQPQQPQQLSHKSDSI